MGVEWIVNKLGDTNLLLLNTDPTSLLVLNDSWSRTTLMSRSSVRNAVFSSARYLLECSCVN